MDYYTYLIEINYEYGLRVYIVCKDTKLILEEIEKGIKEKLIKSYEIKKEIIIAFKGV